MMTMVLSSCAIDSKEYHSYVQSITASMTQLKTKHAQRIQEIQTKKNTLKGEVKELKSKMSNTTQQLKEKLIELKASNTEEAESRNSLKQYKKQIRELKKKMKTTSKESDRKVTKSIIDQLKNKRDGYETVQNNLSTKKKQIRKDIKTLKRSQSRLMRRIYKDKHRIYRLENAEKKENKRFKQSLSRKQKLLKEANELASNKKRYTQQKSILENKISVIKNQIQNAKKEHLPVLQMNLHKFEEKVAFLSESVKALIDKEDEVFTVSPKVKELKESVKNQLAELNKEKDKAIQSKKDNRYELSQLYTKLQQAKTKKNNKSVIQEIKNSIKDLKEKIVDNKRKIAEIRSKKDVIVMKFKAQEKQYYRTKRVEAEKKTFEELKKTATKLRGVFNRIIRIKNALKVKKTETLKQRLEIVQKEKVNLLMKIKVMEATLVRHQKEYQQQLRVEKAQLRMKKVRISKKLEQLQKKLITKKTLVEASKNSNQVINTKEYFLLIDSANRLEDKIQKINSELNALQKKEIRTMKSIVKRMNVVANIMQIKQDNFEIQLARDMSVFHSIVDNFVIQQYNLEVLNKDNAEKEKALAGY